MRKYNTFGTNRTLEPKHGFPQSAWRIDNTLPIHSDEILIRVSLLNINSVSFNEILESAAFNDQKIKQRILQIIKDRGKLHNPVTGSGGMLCGTVEALGADYPNFSNVHPGDDIISLSSLSATPLYIDTIYSIDYENAQIEVGGFCILFSNSPLIKKPSDLPLKLLLAALDEAGAPTLTHRRVQPGQSVLIMGAHSKSGLMCAYAAKDKLSGHGKIVGLIKSTESRTHLQEHGIFDEILCMDASETAHVCGEPHRLYDAFFDVVINCINVPGTEMFSLFAVKNKGTLYCPSLSCDYKFTALTAESIGKEVALIPYTGYLEGHAEYALALIRRFDSLRHRLLEPLSSSARRIVFSERSPAEENIPDIPASANLSGYVFHSATSKSTLAQALKVAQFNSNVLISGASGSGKEIIAQVIHLNSDRKSFPMIKINCAAIPPNLLESELFGYEKGAFTGADHRGKIGLWEAAQNGTLFLDEISELPLSFQAKLLRVIQEREIVRVGGIAPIKVNVRLIAASNRDLVSLVRDNHFRRDLYYRLNVFPIVTHALKHRREDILPLADFFIARYNREFQLEKSLADTTRSLLETLPFPGNIRELQNLVQRMMILSEGNRIVPQDLIAATAFDAESSTLSAASDVSPSPQPSPQPFPDAERAPEPPTQVPTGAPSGDTNRAPDSKKHAQIPSGETLSSILESTEAAVLRHYKNTLGSSRKIASTLGISQPSVVRKLKKYGIE